MIFAEFLKIYQDFMSAYKNGTNNPTINALTDIADKHKLSSDWLTGRRDYTFYIWSMRYFIFINP